TPSTTTRCSSVSDCPAYTLTATLSPDLDPITAIAVRHPPARATGEVSSALAGLGSRTLLARLLLALVLFHEGNNLAALHVGKVGLRHVEHVRRVGAPLLHAGASTAKRWPLHLRSRLGCRVGDLPNAVRPGGGDGVVTPNRHVNVRNPVLELQPGRGGRPTVHVLPVEQERAGVAALVQRPSRDANQAANVQRTQHRRDL